MRGLREAMSGGVLRDGRALAMDGVFWALSGQAGRPKDPLIEVARGESVVMDFVNETAFPHAMHLHGQHFWELGPDGALGDFRDTSLRNHRQTLDAGDANSVKIPRAASGPGSPCPAK